MAADRVENVDAVFGEITAAVGETGASQVATSPDERACSSGDVAEMVETAVAEIETLESRLSTASKAAEEGRRRVREVESSVSELGDI